jgi:hypothetical protein
VELKMVRLHDLLGEDAIKMWEDVVSAPHDWTAKGAQRVLEMAARAFADSDLVRGDETFRTLTPASVKMAAELTEHALMLVACTVQAAVDVCGAHVFEQLTELQEKSQVGIVI